MKTKPNLLPSLTHRAHSRPLGQLYAHPDDTTTTEKELLGLDEWNCTLNRKREMKIKTQNITELYKRPSMVSRGRNSRINSQIEVGLFLARLDSELKRIGQIKHQTIFKNLQYCAGVYEAEYSALLRVVAKLVDDVEREYANECLKLEKERETHIQMLKEMASNKENKEQLPLLTQTIEDRQNNLKALETTQKILVGSRQKILQHCLMLGFDIRKEGLSWILRQLDITPKYDDFPRFLNRKEVEYIIKKYLDEQQLDKMDSICQKKPQFCGKTIEQAYKLYVKQEKRDLTGIQDSSSQLLQSGGQSTISEENHKYLSSSTLQLASQMQTDRSKLTKYQQIYQQAVGKLKKICMDEIYKNRSSLPTIQRRSINNLNGQSLRDRHTKNSTQIIKELKLMLSDSVGRIHKSTCIKTHQSRLLEQLLRDLRIEFAYQQTPKTSRGALVPNRNPITILCCLVGWRKAQKILQNEFAHNVF